MMMMMMMMEDYFESVGRKSHEGRIHYGRCHYYTKWTTVEVEVEEEEGRKS